MNNPSIIALTPGEPAGIGPDISIVIAQRMPAYHLVLIADPAMLRERARKLNLPLTLDEWGGRRHAKKGISILPVRSEGNAVPGRLDTANASYVIKTLETAVDGCLGGEFDALVTGPVHKGVLNDAGIPFTGHTEFLAARSGRRLTVMMLTCPGLRVALATTHIPLSEVSRRITPECLTGVLEILHSDLQEKFAIPDPTILVCGLNPHAGESGYLGREEAEVIAPVIRRLSSQGMRLRGPVPADTAFLPSQLEGVDAVLAMYHDQGLPVLKRHDFARAVNVTLGLPFIRTSVDHGTALELAGSGKADPSSLDAALKVAIKLSKKNRQDVQD